MFDMLHNWSLFLVLINTAVIMAYGSSPKFVSMKEAKEEQVMTIEIKLNVNEEFGPEEYGKLHRAILDALNKRRHFSTAQVPLIPTSTVESTTSRATPAPTIETIGSVMLPGPVRRKRDAVAGNETEITEEQVLFVYNVNDTESIKDGILNLTIFLNITGGNLADDLDFLKGSVAGLLENILGVTVSDVSTSYRDFPETTQHDLDVSTSHHDFPETTQHDSDVSTSHRDFPETTQHDSDIGGNVSNMSTTSSHIGFPYSEPYAYVEPARIDNSLLWLPIGIATGCFFVVLIVLSACYYFVLSNRHIIPTYKLTVYAE